MPESSVKSASSQHKIKHEENLFYPFSQISQKQKPTSPFTLVLKDLQSPINIGQALRVAESFNCPVCLSDQNAVFDSADKKKTISDFACGALQRAGFAEFDLKKAKTVGRVIATCLDPNAEQLPDFVFTSTDFVVIGNEYDGLPETFIEHCHHKLYVPLATVATPKPASTQATDPARQGFSVEDEAPVLNAAMTAGIICYDAFRKTLATT